MRLTIVLNCGREGRNVKFAVLILNVVMFCHRQERAVI